MANDSEGGVQDGRSGDEVAPLPRSWLPDPVAPEGDGVWDARAARIVAATDIEWEQALAAVPGSWVTELGRWWRPTVALAAAAAALLLMTDGPPSRSGGAPPDGAALDLIASDGDPVALWAAVGVDADPVLALIALESPGDGDAAPTSDLRREGGVR